jgi:hypothetical protein
VDTPIYIQGSDLPDLAITWKDRNDAVIDFSTGHTFSLKIGVPGSAALVTKSTGITGAATSPNVTIAWATSGELNTLATGTYTGQLKATRTLDSKERFMSFRITIKPAIS